ncbi:MAG: hypothetical protein AAGA93_05390 [Actinomycetota bacterium]
MASTQTTATDLAGRPLVITFWSFGCEASIAAVERVQDLVAGWPGQVAAVAVHTPRFPYEDDERRLTQAVARHRIDLPVVHDPDYLTWNRYNPVGWPATAVVDRNGRVVGMAHGIDGMDTVVDVVAGEIARPVGRRDRDRPAARSGGASGSGTGGRRATALASVPDRVTSTALDRLERDRDHTSLWFPSALAVTRSGMTAVADTGNDRLLVGRLDDDRRTFRPGVEITDVDRPTAVAFGGDDLLYAIERGTGSVIQIDLIAGTVDIVADGELEAPTDLLVDVDGSLVVADAGRDQLIRIVGTGGSDVLIGPIAGRGATGCDDGPADRAELAQPVAMARTSKGIAFCDAASSNVRILTDGGRVLTATGNEFFDWGLVDGPAAAARFQRPSGLAATADELVVADTGNDRLRVLSRRKVRTLGLTGLDQPTGLAAVDGGLLLVADTGNHRLVLVDPADSRAWTVDVYPAAMTSVWEDEPAEGRRRPG